MSKTQHSAVNLRDMPDEIPDSEDDQHESSAFLEESDSRSSSGSPPIKYNPRQIRNRLWRAPAPSPSPPPLSASIAQHMCTCTGLCTCPKSTTYPNPSPAHLAMWTLDLPENRAPMSSLRETLQVKKNQVTTVAMKADLDTAAWILSSLDGSARPRDKQVERDAQARVLARRIELCFPAHQEMTHGPSVLSQVVEALQAWRETRSYDALKTTFKTLVKNHPDLVPEFEAFLPLSERSGKTEVWPKGQGQNTWEMED